HRHAHCRRRRAYHRTQTRLGPRRTTAPHGTARADDEPHAEILNRRRAMRFGIFYEHQLPRPWHEGDELRLFQHALDQVELADRLGIDNAWEVEHHFLEEYSHSSAPEVFLAACSQRTKNIRL